MSGKVWLVGAGPGDPGLLTQKGERVLRGAQVVVYDRLVGPGILAKIPPDALAIDVGKQAGRHPVPQEQINLLLCEHAAAGRRVVRLKGGDPFLFGRGGEELELLAQRGIPFEVVPGVSSPLAVPAYAGIPVTHRAHGSSVHIVTGHTHASQGPSIDYPTLAALGGTLVFLMGAAALPEICRGLLAAGMSPDTPAAMIQNGATALQRQVCATLAALPQEAAGLSSPAVIVVGQVCGLARSFDWRSGLPLADVRVVVTRPRESASGLRERLEALGAEVIELPAIETIPLPPNAEVFARLGCFEWIAFASPTAVRVFVEQLLVQGRDLRALAGCRLAAVGPATGRALQGYGLRADLLPARYHAAALGEELARQAQGRVLLPGALEPTSELEQALQAAHIPFERLSLYETRPAPSGGVPLGQLIPDWGAVYVAFTSASTVRGFLGRLGEVAPQSVRALCIGEQTARQARQAGMQVFVAGEATMDAMVQRLVELAAQDRRKTDGTD